jgi:hypothetical protein
MERYACAGLNICLLVWVQSKIAVQRQNVGTREGLSTLLALSASHLCMLSSHQETCSPVCKSVCCLCVPCRFIACCPEGTCMWVHKLLVFGPQHVGK